MSYSQSLSGNAYVSMRLRKPEDGRSPARVPIRVRKPERCGHTETVCSVCVGQWEVDYEIAWRSTGAARRLRAELDAQVTP